jgi:hypothetical protein
LLDSPILKAIAEGKIIQILDCNDKWNDIEFISVEDIFDCKIQQLFLAQLA